ncbi:extracellular serine proteinase-like [Glandiceps talaboti]
MIFYRGSLTCIVVVTSLLSIHNVNGQVRGVNNQDVQMRRKIETGQSIRPALKVLDDANLDLNVLQSFGLDMTVFERDEVAGYIAASEPTERISRRYIVVMEDNTALPYVNNVIRALDATSGRGGPSLYIDRQYEELGLGFAGELSDEAIDLVRNIRGVSYVEEDVLFSKQQSGQLPWGLDRVDQMDLPLDNHYYKAGDGTGVDAYIVDTGLRYSHHEFRGNGQQNRASWSGYDAFNTNGNDGSDCDGHGTHVAGILGGKNTGVAGGVNLKSVRVLDCQGNGFASDILDGLNWILKKVRQNPNKRVVVCMSLAGQFTQTVNDAAAKLVREGVVVVAAAGNFKQDACQYSPASESEVLTVGATKIDDTTYDHLGYGSNFGGCIDIFGPGQHIRSSYRNSDSSYHVLSGTSQATPHVAGAAAILLQNDPTLTPVEIRKKLLQGAAKSKINFAKFPQSAQSVTPNKLVYMPQVSNLVTNQPFCRSVWSPVSEAQAGATTEIWCSSAEVMTGCSSLANDNNRGGEKVIKRNGLDVCTAINGDAKATGVYAVARCCLWPSMTCSTETSPSSSSRHDARTHTRCHGEGNILTGCSAHTSGHVIGGARPATNQISIFIRLPLVTCIGQNAAGGSGVVAQASCCKAPQLQCKTVWSSESATNKNSMAVASCEEGWLLTNCNSHAWNGHSAGAQPFDNKCFARNGVGGGNDGVYAVAICCKS